MTEKSYARIVIKDQSGNPKVSLEKPLFGDLTMKMEGGKTIIEQTSGLWGNTKTYMPADGESVEAENY